SCTFHSSLSSDRSFDSHPLCSFFLLTRPPPISTLFPYTTLFRSVRRDPVRGKQAQCVESGVLVHHCRRRRVGCLTHRTAVGSAQDRKSTRLNSSHQIISYAVFCLKKKKTKHKNKYNSEKHKSQL